MLEGALRGYGSQQKLNYPCDVTLCRNFYEEMLVVSEIKDGLSGISKSHQSKHLTTWGTKLVDLTTIGPEVPMYFSCIKHFLSILAIRYFIHFLPVGLWNYLDSDKNQTFGNFIYADDLITAPDETLRLILFFISVIIECSYLLIVIWFCISSFVLLALRDRASLKDFGFILEGVPQEFSLHKLKEIIWKMGGVPNNTVYDESAVHKYFTVRFQCNVTKLYKTLTKSDKLAKQLINEIFKEFGTEIKLTEHLKAAVYFALVSTDPMLEKQETPKHMFAPFRGTFKLEGRIKILALAQEYMEAQRERAVVELELKTSKKGAWLVTLDYEEAASRVTKNKKIIEHELKKQLKQICPLFPFMRGVNMHQASDNRYMLYQNIGLPPWKRYSKELGFWVLIILTTFANAVLQFTLVRWQGSSYVSMIIIVVFLFLLRRLQQGLAWLTVRVEQHLTKEIRAGQLFSRIFFADILNFIMVPYVIILIEARDDEDDQTYHVTNLAGSYLLTILWNTVGERLAMSFMAYLRSRKRNKVLSGKNQNLWQPQALKLSIPEEFNLTVIHIDYITVVLLILFSSYLLPTISIPVSFILVFCQYWLDKHILLKQSRRPISPLFITRYLFRYYLVIQASFVISRYVINAVYSKVNDDEFSVEILIFNLIIFGAYLLTLVLSEKIFNLRKKQYTAKKGIDARSNLVAAVVKEEQDFLRRQEAIKFNPILAYKFYSHHDLHETVQLILN